MIPSKDFPFRSGDGFSRLVKYLRLHVPPQGTPTSGGVRDERSSMIACTPGALALSLSLPPEVDLSSMMNSGTLPECLVTAVWNLRPSLPIGCGLFGEDDLNIVGSYSIGVGGFTDVWMGKMKNGMTVVIKSYRYYSSSSCLPVYMVSMVC